MGMYTGLRCKVIIKPEYRSELDYLHNEIGYEWSQSNIDFLREYGKYSRADFIPRGGLSYMPSSWEIIPKKADGTPDWFNSIATDGFDRTYNPDIGLWTFQCSLKNYDSTIEYFFENVLRRIVEEVIHLEYFYEEWSRSKLYTLNQGMIVSDNDEGIRYKEYDY